MEPASTASISRPALILGAIVVAVAAWFAAVRPVNYSEAYAFTHFVRPPLRDLLGHFDPALSPLNVILMKRTVGLFRLSAFSLRLPTLLGLALLFWVTGRAHMWLAIPLAAFAVLIAGIFSGGGLGLSLLLSALYFSRSNLNLAGLLLGLSVAANVGFLILAVPAAIAVAIVRRRDRPIERFVITATVTAFIPLVLPYSNASSFAFPRSATGPDPAAAARLAADLEQNVPHGHTVRVCAVQPDLVPMLEFYAARDRRNWIFVDPTASCDLTADLPAH